MAATVLVESLHGAAGATGNPVGGLTIKYKRADEDANDTVAPIPKPAGADVYSWRKMTRCKVTVTPDGDITNLRWFTDAGSWGTGVTLWAHTLPWANYAQAVVGDNTTKVPQGAGSAVTDAVGFTSAAPLTVNAGTVLANPTTGYGTQDMVESQIGVANTAARGTKGPRTITYRWDET